MPAVVAVFAGIALGLACGGQLSNLATAKLKGGSVILIGFVVQGVVRGRLPGAAADEGIQTLIWTFVSLAITFLLVWNWRHDGMVVAACGILCNVVVVMANAGMPFDTKGAQAAQQLAVVGSYRGFYIPVGPESVVVHLADVLRIGLQSGAMMFSVGDVLLVVGVISFIAALMKGKSEPSTSR